VKTWNVEGFGYNLANLTENQALAQLSYVACAMLEQGIKQISQSYLHTLLYNAKAVLAEELHYITVSPEEFIQQVENRSSLLIRTGIAKVDGVLEPIYEFRHLTFQEYLAARGYVKEQHARRPDELRLVDILSPHFLDQNWYEVIPLAAALAEHKADGIVRKLIEECDEWFGFGKGATDPLRLLAQCLVDEVSILPATMTAALTRIALSTEDLTEQFATILQGRAGKELMSIVEENHLAENGAWPNYTQAAREVAFYKLSQKFETLDDALADTAFIDSLVADMRSGDNKRGVAAATQFTTLCSGMYRRSRAKLGSDSRIQNEQGRELREALDSMLLFGNAPSIQSAIHALAQAGSEIRMLGDVLPKAEELLNMLSVWQSRKGIECHSMAWALSKQPLLERDALIKAGAAPTANVAKFLKANYEVMDSGSSTYQHEAQAAVLMGWYLRTPWKDNELIKIIDNAFFLEVTRPFFTIFDDEDFERSKNLLATLGKAGNAMLNKREKQKAKWMKFVEQRRAAQIASDDDNDLPF
jgi:hypothetical protein